MLVWGGFGGLTWETVYNSGGRYDPVTDAWSSISVIGAPTGSYAHTAVWTGTEMIVWGGSNVDHCALNSGGRYSP